MASMELLNNAVGFFKGEYMFKFYINVGEFVMMLSVVLLLALKERGLENCFEMVWYIGWFLWFFGVEILLAHLDETKCSG